MKVYYCWYGAGQGQQAICATLERGKQWLTSAITEHNRKLYGDEATDNDPDPWGGWFWWDDERGAYCFGGYSTSDPEKKVAEGYILELEVLE